MSPPPSPSTTSNREPHPRLRIIPRYVIGQFVRFLFLGIGGFGAVYLLLDFIDEIDEYLDADPRLPDLLLYHLLLLPYVALLILPTAMLLASIFTISQLVRHGELVAIKAAGVSLYRVAFPLVACGFMVSGAAFYLADRVVPRTNQRAEEVYRERIAKRPSPKTLREENLFLQGPEGRIFTVRRLDAAQGLAEGIDIQKPMGDEEGLNYRITANRAHWDGEAWHLEDGLVRYFIQNGEERTYRFTTLGERGFNFPPSTFQQERKEPEEMSYGELADYIRLLERQGHSPTKERVDLYLRLAFPLANLVIVLFGTALASRVRASGPAIAFGLSLSLAIVFWGSIQIARAAGYSGVLPPGMAAWSPDLLFGLVGVILLWKAPT